MIYENISQNSEFQNNDRVKVLRIEWDAVYDYFIFSFGDSKKDFKRIIPKNYNILSLITKFDNLVGFDSASNCGIKVCI